MRQGKPRRYQAACDVEAAVRVGAAAGGGALAAILAWLPVNYVLTPQLYAVGRAFLDPNKRPWYDPASRATDALPWHARGWRAAPRIEPPEGGA